MSEDMTQMRLQSDSSMLNVDHLIEQLLSVRGRGPNALVNLPEEDIRSLCLAARDIFLNQPCLLQLATPIKICGDIHGQYHDLLRLFDHGGHPPESNYLFLGDYVDRGKRSLETICLLMCYKVKYPDTFFLLRGNHESASINKMYGFFDECKRRYSSKLWKTFTDCFNCLPIAATVDGKIFCAHGGLSPELFDLEQINRVARPTDVPDTGLLCDLLWSDPDRDIIGWGENDRGVSFTFGEDIARDFLAAHDLDLICRAHQVVEDGYEFFAKRRLVTVFSAPNYCGEFDNAGAMMSVDEGLMCSFQILQSSEKQKRLTRKSSGANRGWLKNGPVGGALSSGGVPHSAVEDPLLVSPDGGGGHAWEQREEKERRSERAVHAQPSQIPETSVPPPTTTTAATAGEDRTSASSSSSLPRTAEVLPERPSTSTSHSRLDVSRGDNESSPAALGSLSGQYTGKNAGTTGGDGEDGRSNSIQSVKSSTGSVSSVSSVSGSSSSSSLRKLVPPLSISAIALAHTAGTAAPSTSEPSSSSSSSSSISSSSSRGGSAAPGIMSSLVDAGVVDSGRAKVGRMKQQVGGGGGGLEEGGARSSPSSSSTRTAARARATAAAPSASDPSTGSSKGGSPPGVLSSLPSGGRGGKGRERGKKQQAGGGRGGELETEGVAVGPAPSSLPAAAVGPTPRAEAPSAVGGPGNSSSSSTPIMSSLLVAGVVVKERAGGKKQQARDALEREGVPLARMPPPPATPLSDALATKGLADIDGVGRSASVWGDSGGGGGGGGGGGRSAGGEDDTRRRRHWLNTAASRRGDRGASNLGVNERADSPETSLSEDHSFCINPSPESERGVYSGSGASRGGGSRSSSGIGGMGMAVAGRGLGHSGQAAAAAAAAAGAAGAPQAQAQVDGGRALLVSPVRRSPGSSAAAAAAAAAGAGVGADGDMGGDSVEATSVSKTVPALSSPAPSRRGEGRTVSDGHQAGRVDSEAGADGRVVCTFSSGQASASTAGVTAEASEASERITAAPEMDHRLPEDDHGLSWGGTGSYAESLYKVAGDNSRRGRGWKGGNANYDAERELQERRRVVQERLRSEAAANGGVGGISERDRDLRGHQRRANARARESAAAAAAAPAAATVTVTGSAASGAGVVAKGGLDNGDDSVNPAIFSYIAYGLATPPNRSTSLGSVEGVGSGPASASPWKSGGGGGVSTDDVGGGDWAGGKSAEPGMLGAPARPMDSLAERFVKHQLHVQRITAVDSNDEGHERVARGGRSSGGGGGGGGGGSFKFERSRSASLAVTVDPDGHDHGEDGGFPDPRRAQSLTMAAASGITVGRVGLGSPVGSNDGMGSYGEDAPEEPKMRGAGAGAKKLAGKKLAKLKKNFGRGSKKSGESMGGYDDGGKTDPAGDLDVSSRSGGSSLFSDGNSSTRSDSFKGVVLASGMIETVKKSAGVMWNMVTSDHPEPLPVEKSMSKEEWKQRHYQMEVARRHDWKTNSIGEQHVLQQVLKQPEEKVWN